MTPTLRCCHKALEAELHVGRCLCPPDWTDGPHPCIHGQSIWIKRHGQWWLAHSGRSLHKTQRRLMACPTWDHAVEWLMLEPWQDDGGAP